MTKRHTKWGSASRGLLTALLLATGVGCSANDADHNAIVAQNRGDQLVDRARDGNNIARVINEKVMDAPYFGTMVTRNQHGQPFPAAWESPGVLFRTVSASDTMNLTEFASELSAELGIAVSLDLSPPQSGIATMSDSSSSSSAGSGAAPSAAVSAMIAAANPGGVTSSVPLVPGTTMATAAPVQLPFADTGAGSLRTFVSAPDNCRIAFPAAVMPLSRRLTFVDATCGVRSTFDGSRISIRRYVEEMFTLASFSSKTTEKIGLGGTSSGGSSSTSTSSSSSSSSGPANTPGTQSLNEEWSLDTYTEVVNGIKARVPTDAVVTANPSAHGVTVVAPPDALERVRKYVDNFNGSVSRQISLLVETVEASLDDADNYGVDLTLALKQAWMGSFTGLPSGMAAATSATLGVTVPANSKHFLRNLAGSSDVVHALTTAGKARLLSAKSFVVHNGSTFALDESTLDDYVSGITSSTTSSNGSTMPGAVQTSTVFSGTKLMIEPLVLPDGLIRLRYQPIIQGKPTFISAGTADALVQLRRDQAVRTFIQEASVQNGGTVIAYAARNKNDTSDNAGVGNANFPLLGGHLNGSLSKNVFVILITPVQLDPLARAAAPTASDNTSMSVIDK